jgi:hypothetical protein
MKGKSMNTEQTKKLEQTLDIEGTMNSSTKVVRKIWGAGACAGFGILLWSAVGRVFSAPDQGELFVLGFVVPLFVIPPVWLFFPNEHTYLDFTARQIVTVKHYLWFETSKRCRPLTDFSNIVVRHLCHSDGEGPETYTGSVGLKPVDGKAVLWVKDFPTTQDEVPRTAYEFARELQEMTGLPGAPGGICAH